MLSLTALISHQHCLCALFGSYVFICLSHLHNFIYILVGSFHVDSFSLIMLSRLYGALFPSKFLTGINHYSMPFFTAYSLLLNSRQTH